MELEEEGFLDSLRIVEKLRCVAVTKHLLDGNDSAIELMFLLRAVEISFMYQQVQYMLQNCLTDFYTYCMSK